MIVEEIYLKGAYLLKPNVINDERGCFMETFNAEKFRREIGFLPEFVQDNQSRSKKGVLRGLHFQKGAYAQAKLIQVIKGEVLDVIVDIRENSETFGEYYKVILNDISHEQLYIPRGFAHGFVALSDEVIFSYKCDNFYHKDAESGIAYDDEFLNIDWEFPTEEMIISSKDKLLPSFKELFS